MFKYAQVWPARFPVTAPRSVTMVPDRDGTALVQMPPSGMPASGEFAEPPPHASREATNKIGVRRMSTSRWTPRAPFALLLTLWHGPARVAAALRARRVRA